MMPLEAESQLLTAFSKNLSSGLYLAKFLYLFPFEGKTMFYGEGKKKKERKKEDGGISIS